MNDAMAAAEDIAVNRGRVKEILIRWTNQALVAGVLTGIILFPLQCLLVPKQVEAAKPVPRIEVRSAKLDWADPSAVAHRSDTFHAELMSVWGSDDGRSSAGRACPPEGYTLVRYDQRPSVTLGDRPWGGSVQQDGNCVAYTISAKHGPWNNRWRHMVNLDITLISRKDVPLVSKVQHGDAATYTTCEQPVTLFSPIAGGPKPTAQVKFMLDAMHYLRGGEGSTEHSEPIVLEIESIHGLIGLHAADKAPVEVRFVPGNGLQIQPSNCAQNNLQGKTP